MQVLTLVFAGIAALVHVYIFVLESLRWDRPSTRSAFGVKTDQEAAATRPLAFNQGFYNLFLALMAGTGITFVAAGSTTVGATLIFASAGSMLAAGLVLWISNPRMMRAALIQLAAPVLAIISGLVAFIA
ncbi:DUF1304 domain-containing protein [Paeniglutamicibacter cryotolerans]|uniref:Putative membrane protein n=1 Tax=Paeniglutamicibacter cryotolerans TaxID=670079 RepID=A0A839QGG3_9MICC|nr:DUF1304 domain-containing protein [Paeniglutamicibacter cryotolerans]MBB2994703.1 putative membrane protein [Paeniglutamicibacter cryotolerans]